MRFGRCVSCVCCVFFIAFTYTCLSIFLRTLRHLRALPWMKSQPMSSDSSRQCCNKFTYLHALFIMAAVFWCIVDSFVSDFKLASCITSVD